MNVNEPTVYISVLNWNGAAKTLSCLASLHQLDYPNYKIIVVDNASRDESVAQIRAAYPELELICTETNLGYADGNRLALEQALQSPDAELFWILNNDTLVQPDTLTKLVESFGRHGMALYGSVSVTQVDADSNRYVSMRQWNNRTSRQLRNVLYETIFTTTEDRIVDMLGGGSLLIPLELVRQYGFIDGRFFLYAEDTDFCFRLRQQHIHCVLVPTSIVFHESGQSHKESRSQLQPIITYYRTRNKIILHRRHFGTWGMTKAVVQQIIHVPGWAALFFTRGSIALANARYTVLGIRDGLLNRMGKTIAPEDYLD